MLACIACMPEKHAHLNGLNFGRRPRGDRIQIWFAPIDKEIRDAMEYHRRGCLVAVLMCASGLF